MTAALLLSLLACAPEPSREGVIVVLVDTLRPDHMSLYGYGRTTTPQTDAFAADAAVFESFTVQAGYTIPSVSSLFSGLAPTAHGCCVIYEEVFADELVSLAEVFQAAGYQTAGLHKSFALDQISADHGFETYTMVDGDTSSGRGAESLTERALAWLENARDERPFFLYLHYTDPHDPYKAPDPWYLSFDEGYDSALNGSEGLGEILDSQPSEDDLQRIRALYDGEIAYLDDHLGRLWDALEAGGYLEGTTIAFLSDHGEQFMEHGALGHEDLWQENIDGALWIRTPGGAGARIEGPTQTIDVAPTLVALAGLDADPGWQGLDLSGAILAGEPLPERDVLSEYTGRRHALLSPDGLKWLNLSGQHRLYDLTADPGETEELIQARPEDAADLQARAEALIAEAEAAAALYFDP